MPHSSGGGSHGGGSHGGGSHRSHGGSRGGRSGPRMSPTYFPNARRYMYHDRRGIERYIYSDGIPKAQSLFSFIFSMVFLIPFVIAGIVTAVLGIASFANSGALTPQYTSPAVHIEDGADVINNDAQLEQILVSFEDLTGICPYIITVYDEDWNQNYDQLVNYAESLYVNRFSDEQHFLVVYSQPKQIEPGSFVDWSWEAMQGDDTDGILTQDNFGEFSSDLHENLLRDNLTVGEAMYIAFGNSLDYMMSMKTRISMAGPILGFSAFWNFIVTIFIVNAIKGFVDSKRDYQEVPVGSGMGNSGTYGGGFDNDGNNYGGNNYGGNNYGANNYGQDEIDEYERRKKAAQQEAMRKAQEDIVARKAREAQNQSANKDLGTADKNQEFFSDNQDDFFNTNDYGAYNDAGANDYGGNFSSGDYHNDSNGNF